MKIVQVGAYPPPFGGVTVHLMRLHEHLRRNGLDSLILDLSATPKEAPGVMRVSWPGTAAVLEGLPPSVVHFHNFDPGHAAAYARVARRHVAVLSLHNERFGNALEELGPLRRRLAISRLRRLHCVVVDNGPSLRMAESLWGRSIEIRRIPEFIPPSSVPPLEHPEILALRARCRYLVASNAWRICFHEGEDLYGLDLAVESLHDLVHRRGLDAGLAFLLPEVGDEAYFRGIEQRVRSLGLDDRCRFVTEPIPESASLWREADVVIRATNTDGSSLSVLEALSLGTPVVASDCTERPEGAVLFRSRDGADLAEKVAAVLSDLPGQRARLRNAPAGGNAAAFVALYGDLRRKWMPHDA